MVELDPEVGLGDEAVVLDWGHDGWGWWTRSVTGVAARECSLPM